MPEMGDLVSAALVMLLVGYCFYGFAKGSAKRGPDRY